MTHIRDEKDILTLVKACRNKDPRSQELLYREFYGYAMGICRRYSRSREEATEIVNDGFFKVMTHLDKYTPSLSFKGWMRRIIINSAIDYFRKNEKHYHTIDVSYMKVDDQSPGINSQLSEEEILKAIQRLPPSYRMVFNLHVIEGYSHEEIAQRLEISAGTSKSNLSIARTKLMKMLGSEFDRKWEQNG